MPASIYPVLSRSQTTALIAVLIMIAAVLTVYLVLRSRLGLALQAIRDSEDGARGLGVDVYRARFAVWLIAAAFTGFAGRGELPAGAPEYNRRSALSVAEWTAPIIVIVVVGGVGTIEGPILGAVIYFVLEKQLTDSDAVVEISPEWFRIVMGLVAVVFALYVRGGIWGSLPRQFPAGATVPRAPPRDHRTGGHLISTQRGIGGLDGSPDFGAMTSLITARLMYDTPPRRWRSATEGKLPWRSSTWGRATGSRQWTGPQSSTSSMRDRRRLRTRTTLGRPGSQR